MYYISGLPAFAIPCELPTAGIWNITKETFLDDNIFKLRDSSESYLKDWGIEENKLIPYHEFATYNVANHIRAYVDMLIDLDFDNLRDLFSTAINNARCRKDIFMLVYGKLRYTADFDEIDEFMTSEFGNAWTSYIDGVNKVAEHIESNQAALDVIDKLQEGILE